MHRLAGGLCIVALVSVPGAASAQVIPLADCVTEGSSPEGQITILAVAHKRIRFVVFT